LTLGCFQSILHHMTMMTTNILIVVVVYNILFLGVPNFGVF
jgi:hypothetical protein